MTDREKAIIMAYTGICMLAGEKMDVFYQYLEELYERPIYTHEWMTLDIQEKSKPDFIKLCKEEEPERKKGKWIHDGFDFPHGVDWIHCSECGRREPNVLPAKTPYCPSCGARMEKGGE